MPIVGFSQKKREIANNQVLKLRSGVLLVRLYTSENKINALRKLGRNKEAEEVIRKQHLENKAIYTSFTSVYDFSKVYFFYNTCSEKIKNREFTGNLLNAELEVDSSIIVNPGDFFISEFDFTPGTGLYALVVKDCEFEFLKKPFPYYIKRFDIIPISRRTPFDMVLVLNTKLHQQLKKIPQSQP